MSAERDDNYDIPLQGDEIYETLDVVNNPSYGDIKKLAVVDSTTAPSVPAPSHHVSTTNKNKKKDLTMTKQCGRVLTCLVALIIIALMIVALVQISKLRSDVVLQANNLKAVESIIDTRLSELNDRFDAVTRLMLDSAANLIRLDNEANNRLENISDSLSRLDNEANNRLENISDSLSRLDNGANNRLENISVSLSRLDNEANNRLENISVSLSRLDNEANNRLENISDSLSIFINLVISKTTTGNTNLEALFVDILNVTTGYAFASCAAIHQRSPSSPSGYYHIRSSNGSAVRVYCDMIKSCGDITGGWMRVAKMDMTDTTTQCPSGLELRTSPRRTCRTRNSSSGLCSSDTFPVDGVGYSKVCGRIRAYQVGITDAFGQRQSANIETNYVDGVSLTHGRSPRQHIWTFAAALNEDDQYPLSICPCINTAISSMVPPPPSFVGEDYFCDTATRTGFTWSTFYADDPLWDGAGCGTTQNTCCSFNTPPWFYKQLQQTTTDDIEMRVCRSESRADEDIAIEVVEIYVQ